MGRRIGGAMGARGRTARRRGDRLRQVERLGVGGHQRRHQPDPAGQRRHPGGDEHRVEPAAHLVGALVGREAVGGLQGEGVLERHEVQQPALGLGDQVEPVARAQELGGTGAGFAPGGGVPARPVEGDADVQRFRIHRRSFSQRVEQGDPHGQGAGRRRLRRTVPRRRADPVEPQAGHERRLTTGHLALLCLGDGRFPH